MGAEAVEAFGPRPAGWPIVAALWPRGVDACLDNCGRGSVAVALGAGSAARTHQHRARRSAVAQWGVHGDAQVELIPAAMN
jgi:hypothetical protein